MKPDPESIRKILLNARQAMQRGDRQAARSWAEQAVALDPDSEEPWLFLAALSSPHASVKYLERALKLNPHSQRARKGMHWAVERLRHEQVALSSEKHTPPRSEQVETREGGTQFLGIHAGVDLAKGRAREPAGDQVRD